MRKALVLGSLVLSVAGSAFLATPADAAAGDTLVTFTVGVGVPSVAVVGGVWTPGLDSTSGGSTYANGTIVGTVITDTRIPTLGGTNSWSDSIASTAFNLIGATSPSGTAQIPAASAVVTNDLPVVTIPGTATVTNDHPSGTPLTLGTTGAQLLHASTTNANVVTFTTNVKIDTTGKDLGAYSGTITQTVTGS